MISSSSSQLYVFRFSLIYIPHHAHAVQVLSVGQSVAVWVACENGLGRHYNTLSATNKDTFFKVSKH